MPDKHNSSGLIAAVCCLLLSSACTSLHPPAETAATKPAISTLPTTTNGQRSYQEQIQLNGKINIQYRQADKPQSMTVSFEWEQDRNSIHVRLLSPLGQTMAIITQTANLAILEQAGKEPQQADNLDQLMQNTLGWPLPVAGLRDWLQGFVAIDGKTAKPLKPEDQTLMTQGWKLRYVSWHENSSLPKLINLQRYTEQAGEVSIRIALDQGQ